MMHDESKYIRKTIQIDPELEKTIQAMADVKNRSFSYICSVLLRQAINEKNRKKRAAKSENNTQHNTSNLRSGNAGG